MKFLVDAQLPKSLSDLLSSKGHDSLHTIELPVANQTTDIEIIRLATKSDRIVISKDDDFLQSFLVKSQPKSLILVKIGNIKNSQLIELFDRNLNTLQEMLGRSNLIEISQTEITEHQ